jgi:hypothetical protein
MALKPNEPSPVATSRPARTGEARRDSERNADNDAAESSRVEDRGGGQADPGEAQEITSVDNHNRVGVELLLQGSEHPIRVHPPIAPFCDRHGLPQLRGAFLVPRPQAADPIAIDGGFPVAGAVRDRRQGLGRARKDLDLAAAVVAQFRRRIGNAHETRRPNTAGET